MGFYTVVGGSLHPAMCIDWNGEPPVTAEDIEAQFQAGRRLALPSFSASLDTVADNGRKLAVVGGGPSIKQSLALLNWDGDIWAINGAYHWVKAKGFDPTFIASDPHIIVASWAKGVTKALVTTRCHAEVFKLLAANKADVRTFDLDGDNKILSGSSTATSAVHLAILDGYKDITFFGCEGSYDPGFSHAYMHEVRKEELCVEVGGEHYHTAPDFFMQSLELANIFRMTVGEGRLREESGGLLRALIKDPVYRIAWVSQGLFDGLKRNEPQPALEAAE